MTRGQQATEPTCPRLGPTCVPLTSMSRVLMSCWGVERGQAGWESRHAWVQGPHSSWWGLLLQGPVSLPGSHLSWGSLLARTPYDPEKLDLEELGAGRSLLASLRALLCWDQALFCTQRQRQAAPTPTKARTQASSPRTSHVGKKAGSHIPAPLPRRPHPGAPSWGLTCGMRGPGSGFLICLTSSLSRAGPESRCNQNQLCRVLGRGECLCRNT